MYNAKNIGEFIEKQRTSKRLTQKELAQLLYVKVEDIIKWEQGEDLPDDVSIKYLSTIFKVSIKELLSPPVSQTNSSITNTINNVAQSQESNIAVELQKVNNKPSINSQIKEVVKKPTFPTDAINSFEPQLKVEVKEQTTQHIPKNDLNFTIPLFETKTKQKNISAESNLHKNEDNFSFKELSTNQVVKEDVLKNEAFNLEHLNTTSTKTKNTKVNNKKSAKVKGKFFRGLMLFLRIVLSAAMLGIFAFIQLENEFIKPMLWEVVLFTGSYTFIYLTVSVIGLSALIFILNLFFTMFCGKILKSGKAKLKTFYVTLFFTSLLLIVTYYNYYLLQEYFIVNINFMLAHYMIIILSVVTSFFYTLSALFVKSSVIEKTSKVKIEKLEMPKNWLD